MTGGFGTGGPAFVAVDIGASSGRVILGTVSPAGRAMLDVVHRFPNGVLEHDGHLHWDLPSLFAQVLTGLRAATERAAAAGQLIISIGIDTWAVDYGLLDAQGNLEGLPFSYRDGRGATAVDAVHRTVGAERLYARTGLQHLPFNTLYQLATEAALDGKQALLLPDLLAFMLSGVRRTESTNASTTGLFDAGTGRWATSIMAELGLPDDLFPPLIEPGGTIGALLADIAEETGLPVGTRVVAVGSHDTASAVAAVPAATADFAYVSSGTWSLVGVELDAPVLSEASRLANFTNERGVDGRIRYLRNVGGLWLLSESLREWELQAHASGNTDAVPVLESLLEAAAAEPAGGPVIDVDSERFIAPGRMPARILAAVHAAGSRLEARPAAIVRCILDSLAAAYARTITRARELSGKRVQVIHIVGGGSQNALLCQLTADATGLPVVAGPVEATALGNVLVQARAAGILSGGLETLREVVRASQQPMEYLPVPAGS